MNHQPSTIIFPSTNAVTQAIAQQLILLSKQYIGKNHRFNLAISSDDISQLLLQTLASDIYQGQINWHKTHLFLTQENSDLSVTTNLNTNLTEHVDIPPQNLHLPHALKTDIKKSAASYQIKLIHHFGYNPPDFDLIIIHRSLLDQINDPNTVNNSNLLITSNNSLHFSLKLIQNSHNLFIITNPNTLPSPKNYSQLNQENLSWFISK